MMEKQLAALGLCASLSVCAAGAVKSGDLIFDADFTQSKTSADASFAAGDPAGSPVLESAPRMDVEPMSTINNGLLIGEGCASVRFRAEKNLNFRSVTVEMVLKSIDWEWGDGKVHIFLQCLNGEKSSFYLYQHGDDGLGVYLSAGKEHVFPRRLPKEWKKDEKHHVLFTLNKGVLKLYLDGKPIREAVLENIPEPGKYFEIGSSSSKFGRNGRSVVSRLTIYNRALSDEEVRELAGQRLPELSLSSMMPEKENPLPSSEFFRSPQKIALDALTPEYVPAPWTPVVRSDTGVSVWNRTYSVGGGNLFEGIRSGGSEILAGGINLNADGRDVVFGEPEIRSEAPGRVVFVRRILSPENLPGELEYQFEYDGAVFLKLVLDGKTNPAGLVLSIPFRKEFSNLFHFVGAVQDSLKSIVGPDDSNSKILCETPGILWEGGFHTHLWAGGNGGGVQFFLDSDRGVFPKDRKDLFRLIRREDGTLAMEFRCRTEAFPENPENTVEFGLIATPVRPMPPRWRETTVSAQYDSFQKETRGSLVVYWPDEWALNELDPEPGRMKNPERIREKVLRDHAENRSVTPYYDRLHLLRSFGASVNPDANYARNNWGPVPQRSPGGSSRDVIRCTSTSGWSDYLVWCLDRFNRACGPFDGFYMDEMEPTPNTREVSGGGYTAFDGSRRPTYPMRADRNLYKRMNHILTGGKTVPRSIAHCSGTNIMEVLSAFPFFLTGEHLYSGYFPDRKDLLPPENDRLYYYSYALPMERIRAEFYHGQWGSAEIWLPCLKNQKDIMDHPEAARDMLSRIQHADVIFWPLWCNRDEMLKVERFRREFRIGDADVGFVPYWENRILVSPSPETAIGFYHAKDRVLAIVSNLSRLDQVVELTLPPNWESAKITDAETRSILTPEGRTLRLKMKRNDYAAVRFDFQEKK